MNELSDETIIARALELATVLTKCLEEHNKRTGMNIAANIFAIELVKANIIASHGAAATLTKLGVF